MPTIDLRKTLKKHKSGWVALAPDNKKEVAAAKTLHEVLIRAKAKGILKPIVFKAPKIGPYYVG